MVLFLESLTFLELSFSLCLLLNLEFAPNLRFGLKIEPLYFLTVGLSIYFGSISSKGSDDSELLSSLSKSLFSFSSFTSSSEISSNMDEFESTSLRSTGLKSSFLTTIDRLANLY